MLIRFGLLLFTSGFCALVYQVTWLRMLRHVFGGSTFSTAAVLAIFMGGLGLGAALIGRRSSRFENPLKLYAHLEIGIALSAAVSPWLVDGVRAIYFSFAEVSSLGGIGSTLIRLLLSVVVLGLPTTLMGATLPAIAQAMERQHDANRRRTAAYYGINSLGAVVGTLATTFVFLEFLGIRQCLGLAAAINLLVAMLARHLARSVDAGAPIGSRAENELSGVENEPIRTAPKRWDWQVRIVLLTSFVVGFVFFLMEIVWFRMLTPILGGSSFTFGLILAVALLGIALGGLLFSRRSAETPPTFGALAITCGLEALCLAFPLFLGDRIAVFAAVLRGLSALGFSGVVGGWMIVTMIVVFPTALVAGYQFPLLVALMGGGRKQVGPEVGAAAACNTFGAIAGSLAGGFGLLPLLGAVALWRLDVWALVTLSLSLAVIGRRTANRRQAWFVVALALLASTFALSQGPTAFWRHTAIGAGRFTLPATAFDLKRAQNQAQLSTLVSVDGIESNFALSALGDLALINNGKSDGTAVGDAITTVSLGLVPGMLHPNPREALVIGLGSGTTAGWLGTIDTIHQVDIVELEPTVGSLARHFGAVNQKALENPKIKVLYTDGRALIQTSQKQYDLIVSEPSNPYRAGVADLFSQDFYRVAARRLRPGGMMAQWLQGYGLDNQMVKDVAATLHSVFPHVEIWRLMPEDLLLVASAEPITHDFDRVRRLVHTEPWNSALRTVMRLEPSAESFYSGFVGSPLLIENLADAGEISTDDRPHLEFGFARHVGYSHEAFVPAALGELAHKLGADLPTPAKGVPLEAAELAEAAAIRFPPPPHPPGTAEHLPSQIRIRARHEFREGRDREAARTWQMQDAPPRHPSDLLLMAVTLAQAGDSRYREVTTRLVTSFERNYVSALFHRATSQNDLAFAELLKGWQDLRENPFAPRAILLGAFALGRDLVRENPRRAPQLFAALEQPFAVRVADPERILERFDLTLVLPDAGKPCLQVFAETEPNPFWDLKYLELRYRCYSHSSHPLAAKAARDWELALAQTARPLDETGTPSHNGASQYGAAD